MQAVRFLHISSWRFNRLLRFGVPAACHGLGILFLAGFLYISWHHLGFPYELEWMEGGMLEHVHRLAQHQAIYVAPSLEFIPFSYTPLYFYFGAFLATLGGAELWGLRLLSIVSILFSMGLMAWWSWRETGSRAAAWLAVSLFAATYECSGAWWSLARVDSLFLALLLSGGFLLRHGRAASSTILAGVVLALAFFCKQTGVLIALPMLVYAWWHLPRARAWQLSVAYAMVILAGTLWLEWRSGGWFSYYCVQVPRDHPFILWRIHHFWLDYFIQPLPIASAFALAFLIKRVIRMTEEGVFWLFFAGAIVLGSWISQIPSGSYHNVAIPGHAVLAMLAASGAHQGMKSMGKKNSLVWGFLFMQLLMALYDPRDWTPNKDEIRVRDEMVRQLAVVAGPVWMPDSGHLAVLAGHPAMAHRCAIDDVLRSTARHGDPGLRQAVQQAIHSGPFTHIVMNDEWLAEELLDRYDRRVAPFAATREMRPKTGWQTQPQWFYFRKPGVF